MASTPSPKIGWIGIGRMGYAMAERLAKAGVDITVWNRARAKAEPLVAAGAKVAGSLVDDFRQGLKFDLDPFQIEACRLLEAGNSVLVAAEGKSGLHGVTGLLLLTGRFLWRSRG